MDSASAIPDTVLALDVGGWNTALRDAEHFLLGKTFDGVSNFKTKTKTLDTLSPSSLRATTLRLLGDVQAPLSDRAPKEQDKQAAFWRCVLEHALAAAGVGALSAHHSLSDGGASGRSLEARLSAIEKSVKDIKKMLSEIQATRVAHFDAIMERLDALSRGSSISSGSSPESSGDHGELMQRAPPIETRKRKAATAASAASAAKRRNVAGSRKAGRKSGRLNRSMPTTEAYTIVPELECLRGEWPGKRVGGENSWIAIFGDEDDASVEEWQQSGYAEMAENVLLTQAVVQFPPELSDVTRQALLEFVSSFFFGLNCAEGELGVDEDEFVGLEQDDYGPQCDADELLEHLIEQQDGMWQVMVTSHDLVGLSLNFLFGLSSYDNPACVLSVRRLASLPGGPKGSMFFRQMARQIASGMCHNLGFKHCVVNECLMNGVNTLEEKVATPVDLCPQCLSKLWLASKRLGSLPDRYKRLAGILRKMGGEEDASMLERMRSVLQRQP